MSDGVEEQHVTFVELWLAHAGQIEGSRRRQRTLHACLVAAWHTDKAAFLTVAPAADFWLERPGHIAAAGQMPAEGSTEALRRLRGVSTVRRAWGAGAGGDSNPIGDCFLCRF